MSIANQQEWLSSPLGDYLQAQEQSIFDEAVGDVFGFNAIQVGMLQMDLLRNSRIPFSIRANLNPGQIPGQLLCDSVQLPFSSNSIDLLLLPHGLDFSTNPQQTLREAERVLVAEGHIMITGFNPVSSWGLKHMVGKHSNYPNNNYPWNSSFLSLLRVKDWLALLGFEMVTSQMTCYSPPLSKAAWLQRFQFMDKVGGRWWPMMGGVYFIVAKKKVVGMRLIRPNWSKAKFKSSLVATPSQKGDCQKTGEGQD